MNGYEAPIRTIIVDDEARIRRGIERLVRSCGEAFEVAALLSDGQEALQYMHDHQGMVDLVLTDVKMPEMDGVAFVQEAKKHYTFSPLFISGYDDFEYLRSAMREGAVDYILKPIDRTQFRSRMEEIKSMIMQRRKQSYVWQDMQKKAQQYKQARQTQLLINVTSTEVDLSRLGYWVDEFPAGCYILLYISVDALPYKARSYTERDWMAYSYALENIIGELAADSESSDVTSHWWWRSETDFWLLLHRDDGTDNELLASSAARLAETICGSIRRFTPFTASVSGGEVIEDLYLLRHAKQQAWNLMNYRLVLGGNQVFTADMAIESEAGAARVEAAAYQTVQRLVHVLRQANAEAALRQLQILFEQLEQKTSPSVMQWMLQYLYIQIHAVWMESTEQADPSISLEKALHEVRSAVNLGQIKHDVRRWVQYIADKILADRESDNVKPVELAKRWILEHLGEELTVKKIADIVYMNPTYFCKCFKAQTGETVLDYVTRMRMERAAELLGDYGRKLNEISRAVGYQDAKYFSKLFRHWAGVSPSEYRQQRRQPSE